MKKQLIKKFSLKYVHNSQIETLANVVDIDSCETQPINGSIS